MQEETEQSTPDSLTEICGVSAADHLLAEEHDANSDLKVGTKDQALAIAPCNCHRGRRVGIASRAHWHSRLPHDRGCTDCHSADPIYPRGLQEVCYKAIEQKWEIKDPAPKVNAIFDKPVVGVVVAVLASIVIFVPTIVAHRRRIQAFPSVSALSALTLLLVVCTLASPLFLWGASAVWLTTLSWSVAGKRRDA